MNGISGLDRDIMFRYNDPENYYDIRYGRNSTGGVIALERDSGNASSLLYWVTYPLNDNQFYHFEISAYSNVIVVKINGDTVINYTDTDTGGAGPIYTGGIRLRVQTILQDTTEVWYDNVLVTTDEAVPTPTVTPTPSPSPSPTPLPLPNLNVPDIKQYSDPWGTQIYDHATSWSPAVSNPFIKNFGCALASADMVLQYYGFPITPDALNTWLNSQSDGYVGEGLVNWLAISRYTKTSPNAPIHLEFKKFQGTTQDLTNEIASGRPAILEEPGHFIVAKGQTPDSFSINDPFYPDRTTLSSYNNTFKSIESYIPAHTDLSYIQLTIDPKFNLKIFGSDGNEITGDTSIENPITDPVTGQTNGNPVKVFMFPKPSTGNYTVQVTGNGIYELDSYLYDKDGNLNLTKTTAIADTSQSDNYNITIDTTNSGIANQI